MERLKKVIADTVFVVQVLIAFILIFESSIQVPAVVQAFGRMHPLLLHLPIGLLLVTVVLIFTQQYFGGKALDDLVSFLLHLTALTASLTTIMGLLLSLEGTFGADQLWAHKWLGVSLSFLCWALLIVKGNVKVLKPLSLAGVVVLIVTGHFGANLTHGEDFVWAPLQTDEPRVARVITDSTEVFFAAIEPILESKCYGCHNRKKAKGNLVLTSLETIAKGGKTGDLWKPNDAAHSLIVERLSLPLENEDHMPPKDKTQLTEDEISFISLWIDAGSDTGKKLNELAADDTLKQLASAIITRYHQPDQNQPLYTFKFASPEKIEKLGRPNRSVFQIARNEPAIQADFYLRQNYEKKHLEELVEIKEQLISLNLANMPVEDADLKTIAKFSNLEVLNLNNTPIKGNGFKAFAALSKLRSLSLSGTDVTSAALPDLGGCKNLEEVFLWNTAITEKDVESLKKELPHIRWGVGYIPDANEILKLNPPSVKNDSRVLKTGEKVVLSHNLPGTIVRYSIDGTDPDSLKSPVYKEPVELENYSIIKAKAFKDGWLSSDMTQFVFFEKGFNPSKTELLTTPDDEYPGEGATTLIDGKKGLPDFYRLPAWMAFRNNDLIASFDFSENAPAMRSVTLSYAKNVRAMIMPPGEIQVWGGNDPARLELITKVSPPQPKDYEPTRIEGVSVDLPSTKFRYYKLVASPLPKMPAFRKAKKGDDKAWLMVDEVFFN